mmetsp:Transcript_18483/g.49545  ORF Transcript_18483/g.49545 Transcript_18483/m.49545 type:complete len:210 (+) Transcript_18483:61-690(+)
MLSMNSGQPFRSHVIGITFHACRHHLHLLDILVASQIFHVVNPDHTAVNQAEEGQFPMFQVEWEVHDAINPHKLEAIQRDFLLEQFETQLLQLSHSHRPRQFLLDLIHAQNLCTEGLQPHLKQLMCHGVHGGVSWIGGVPLVAVHGAKALQVGVNLASLAETVHNGASLIGKNAQVDLAMLALPNYNLTRVEPEDGRHECDGDLTEHLP